MRSIVAGIAGFLAVLLLPVAIVAFWATQTLTQTEPFVADMAPVVQQPAVQQALTDQITQGVLDAANLGPTLQRVVEPTLRSEAGKLVASPTVATAFSTALGVAHAQTIKVLEGEADTRVTADGRVVLRLKIPVPPLTSALERVGVPNAQDIVPTVSIPLVSAATLDTAQRIYQPLAAVGPWSPWIVAGLALVAIGLAGRRRRAAAYVAVGWLALSGILALVLALARDPLLSGVTPPAARAIADAAYDTAAGGLHGEIWVAVAVSAVLLVGVAAVGLAQRAAARN